MINTLQGYRFDKDDILGLQFSYANKQSNVLSAAAAVSSAKGEERKDAAPPSGSASGNVAQSLSAGAENAALATDKDSKPSASALQGAAPPKR